MWQNRQQQRKEENITNTTYRHPFALMLHIIGTKADTYVLHQLKHKDWKPQSLN